MGRKVSNQTKTPYSKYFIFFFFECWLSFYTKKYTDINEPWHVISNNVAFRLRRACAASF